MIVMNQQQKKISNIRKKYEFYFSDFIAHDLQVYFKDAAFLLHSTEQFY